MSKDELAIFEAAQAKMKAQREAELAKAKNDGLEEGRAELAEAEGAIRAYLGEITRLKEELAKAKADADLAWRMMAISAEKYAALEAELAKAKDEIRKWEAWSEEYKDDRAELVRLREQLDRAYAARGEALAKVAHLEALRDGRQTFKDQP